ncbi:toll-like receptor 13 [Engraulis encrasicolus]|uniref:toll-like receptor 13 n=1 Tax=Engraulis encrasicolus TaxID=184585 RepID=UPI002FD1D63A
MQSSEIKLGANGLSKFHHLQSLYIYGCLSEIDPEAFAGLTDLHMLSIASSQHCNASLPSKLKHLEITGNGISEIQANTFSGLRNLESLKMSGHNLKHLEASCFAHLPSLRVLHLRYSGMQLLNLASIFGGFPRGLSDFTLTSGRRDMTLVIPNDRTTKVDLSLNLSGRKIVLWGCERPLLKSVTKIEIFSDLFVCAPNNTTPFPHLKSVVDLSFSQWHASTINNLTSLNRLVKLKRLDLMNINFINLPDIALVFRNLTNMELLSLSHIWVDSLEAGLVQDMTSLKYLYLDHIATEVSISPGFFEHLPSLRFAQITKIQLCCTCDNIRFLRWAKQQQQVQVYLHQDKPLQCISGKGAPQDIERYGQAYCSLDLGRLMFASTSCVLLLFLSTVLLHQLAREYLLAFYRIAHGWMNEVLRDRETMRHHRYQYDAFVSYSGKDEPWVVQTLLPNLEQQRGPPFLQLCLHTRDFQLGKDIVENITDGLYRSRRTLCLVSRHFLRSHWCSLEMRLGTYRLQAERRDVLVLVFLEKIPSNLLSAHHRLARLVKTRTYMEWPQDPERQMAFWDRLWNKLLEGRV